jgi:hypothetical protein
MVVFVVLTAESASEEKVAKRRKKHSYPSAYMPKKLTPHTSKGKSVAVIQRNIRTLENAGYSPHGAVAAAYNMAYPQHRPTFPGK